MQNESVLNEAAAKEMTERILEAKAEGDSVGGVTQTAVTGLPAGVGEPWFDSVESVLSHALFSIGGVKGVDFGVGFAGAGLRGSEYNDALRMAEGAVRTLTNRNGGVNGGITNGMPVTFRCAVKPTPSIAKRQQTVDFINNEETDIEIKGRLVCNYISNIYLKYPAKFRNEIDHRSMSDRYSLWYPGASTGKIDIERHQVIKASPCLFQKLLIRFGILSH